jgi:DHA1 family multidrug resistance protein-like MFS transporter
MLGYTTYITGWGSSIFSPGISQVTNEFHVSGEVGILGVSLFVLGFATGPILWAPISELYGRRLPIIISLFGYMLFQFATATGKDLQTVLICRFWGGFFGACPVTVVPAVLADIFDNKSRGLAITAYSLAVSTSPLLAPVIAGFIIANKSLDWRWTEYITGIMAALAFVLNALFLDETYPPAILQMKAADLRRRTKNWGIHAKQDEIEIDLRELISKNVSRPLALLFTEPIVLLVSVYMSFIYGLLYIFLTAYPIVFEQVHGFPHGVGELPYLGMIVGMLLAGVQILAFQPWYNKKLIANHGIPIPEWRLPPMIIGGVAFTGGLFWFGWSGYRPETHWIIPTLSGLLTGFGILSIFLQSLNYIVDVYLIL